jgi:hypothetical protein
VPSKKYTLTKLWFLLNADGDAYAFNGEQVFFADSSQARQVAKKMGLYEMPLCVFTRDWGKRRRPVSPSVDAHFVEVMEWRPFPEGPSVFLKDVVVINHGYNSHSWEEWFQVDHYRLTDNGLAMVRAFEREFQSRWTVV